MRERRWKDPRTLRVWKVDVCPIAPRPGAPSDEPDTLMLCFESTGTPRAAHVVRCCSGVRGVLDTLDDQSLALCLDAAIAGGFLWVDPRDHHLWWVREEEDGIDGRRLRFVGCGGELGVGAAAPGRGRLESEALMSLRDRAAPRSAA